MIDTVKKRVSEWNQKIFFPLPRKLIGGYYVYIIETFTVLHRLAWCAGLGLIGFRLYTEMIDRHSRGLITASVTLGLFFVCILQ